MSLFLVRKRLPYPKRTDVYESGKVKNMKVAMSYEKQSFSGHRDR